MIRPFYALKLARTKLRSKRGILIASVIVASLLFAGIIAIIIVFTGAEKSATEFIKKAGNDRYLVKVQPNIPYEKTNYLLTPSLDQIREIKAFEKQYYDELKQKYKSLGLDYNETSQLAALEPFAYADKNLPEEQRVKINFASPVIRILQENMLTDYEKTATNKFSDLKQISEKYKAAGFYITDKSTLTQPVPSLRLIQDGKENFGQTQPDSSDSTPYGYYTHTIENSFYNFSDQHNLSRYLLNRDPKTLKGIPVVVSAQEAARLFGKNKGIPEEPNEQIDKQNWVKSVQSKLNGTVYQACYRNSAELAMLDKIQRDYADMKNHETDKDYRKPSLIYDYPKEACGNITVKEDTRTVAERQADQKLEADQKKLGTYVEPNHHLLTFQIVGFKYAEGFTDHTKGVKEYLKGLLSSTSDQFNAEIPIQMYESLPEELKIPSTQIQEMLSSTRLRNLSEDFNTRIVEFPTVAEARAFIENEGCREYSDNCDKKFIADPYGSNYLILDEIGSLFNKITLIAFPILLGLAAIIIWFTVSRIMSENRRETAIYRAMGAKRSDIASIYTIYVLLIALRIAFISIIIGLVTAFIIDQIYGKNLSSIAITSFGIIDEAPGFSLFNLSSPLLIVVTVSIFIISLIASLQPLIRNVRRSPIKDMRDDG